MWCAYPRCFRGAEERCDTCGRRYCLDHCSHLVLVAGMRLHECDLCHAHVSLDEARAAHRPGLVASTFAVILFLVAVAVGTAVDVLARGTGFIAFWSFTLAFIALTTCLQH
jgi:hypothetical protein